MLKVWIVHFTIALLITLLVVFDGGGNRKDCELVGTCECGTQLKVWYYIYMASTTLNFLFECLLYHQLNLARIDSRKSFKKFQKIMVIFCQPICLGICVWGGFRFYETFVD